MERVLALGWMVNMLVQYLLVHTRHPQWNLLVLASRLGQSPSALQMQQGIV